MEIAKVYGNMVLLKEIDSTEETTNAGIIIQHEKDPDQIAEVLMTGEDVAFHVTGDKVLYNINAVRYRNEEKKLLIIEDKNILAKVK